jgi:hypothetical protein
MPWLAVALIRGTNARRVKKRGKKTLVTYHLHHQDADLLAIIFFCRQRIEREEENRLALIVQEA